MTKLLVFQHVPHEILGTLNPLLKDAGFRIHYVNFGRHPDARPSLDGYHGLLILGGPMGVGDREAYPHLQTELEVIAEALDRGLPMLGICLGAQLIATALGAEVKPNRRKEIGWYDVAPTATGDSDPLFSHFRGVERIFQWHGDTFAIPRGAVHLATSAACTHQAFRYGKNVYGLQFHLEVDEAMIDRWLRVQVNREELQALHGEIDADEIRYETHQRIGRSKALAGLVFGEFIKLFALKPKRVVLPSR